jgi:hypothetical protein
MFRSILAATLLFGLSCIAQPAQAWDEVTHSHITAMAIANVQTPELKRFLQAHRNEVISGSWFPDWPFQGKTKSNGYAHDAYLDAAWADLQQPAVKRESNYNRLLAHFMGTYAHVVEDRVFDSTLGAADKEDGDIGRDDMETGMVSIATYHYLKRNFSLYVPTDDLTRIYAENNYFGETAINKKNLGSFMHVCMEKQDVENRLLKLLSYLSAGWSRRAFPYAAVNMPTAPGGFEDNARAVAAVWEAVWAKVHGKTAPLLVFSFPSENGQLVSLDQNSSLGHIVVVASERIDLRKITANNVVLRGEHSGPVALHLSKTLAGNARDVYFHIEALQPWRRGENYHLTVAYPDGEDRVQTFNLDFRAPETVANFTKSNPEPFPFGFGLWCAVAILGVGGMVYGLFGAGCLAFAAIFKRLPDFSGLGIRGCRQVCKTAGLGLLLTALWFLVTDGNWLIAYLRMHS